MAEEEKTFFGELLNKICENYKEDNSNDLYEFIKDIFDKAKNGDCISVINKLGIIDPLTVICYVQNSKKRPKKISEILSINEVPTEKEYENIPLINAYKYVYDQKNDINEVKKMCGLLWEFAISLNQSLINKDVGKKLLNYGIDEKSLIKIIKICKPGLSIPKISYKDYLCNYFYDYDNYFFEPVCREERQYALFLYNKLLSLVGKEYRKIKDNDEKEFFKKFIDIENNENSDAKILQVYYEVTFMRDFLEKDEKKATFDKNLNDYINGILSKHLDFIDKNLKRNIEEYKQIVLEEYKSAMMHCKADLGILYLNGEKLHLKFIECKYQSKVKPYNMLEKAKNIDVEFLIKQYGVQYYVTKFICLNLFPNITADYPIFLRFVINEENDLTNSAEEIWTSCCKNNYPNNCKCDSENCNYDCLNCKDNKDYYEYCVEFVAKFIEGNEKQILISKIVPQRLKDSINEIKSFF